MLSPVEADFFFYEGRLEGGTQRDEWRDNRKEKHMTDRRVRPRLRDKAG